MITDSSGGSAGQAGSAGPPSSASGSRKVATGILANSVQALHEAGVWNHWQTVLFDFSAALPMDSQLGSILAGMFGYQEAPTVSTLGAYLIYLVVALVMFFIPSASSQPVANTSSVSSQ